MKDCEVCAPYAYLETKNNLIKDIHFTMIFKINNLKYKPYIAPLKFKDDFTITEAKASDGTIIITIIQKNSDIGYTQAILAAGLSLAYPDNRNEGGGYNISTMMWQYDYAPYLGPQSAGTWTENHLGKNFPREDHYDMGCFGKHPYK